MTIIWEDEQALPFKPDPDDAIEAMLEAGDNKPVALKELIEALQNVRSEGTRKRLYLGIAIKAEECNAEYAFKVLYQQYQQYQHHPVLATSLISAMAILASVNQNARTELIKSMLVLDLCSSRYILVRALKVLGKIADHTEKTVVQFFERCCEAQDLSVQSEAYFQLAVMQLRSEVQQIKERLPPIRGLFERSDETEEYRVDARRMLHNINKLLADLDNLTK